MDTPEVRVQISDLSSFRFSSFLEPFSFRSADEVLRDDAVDSNAATLEDVDDRVDNGLSSNGLPRCRIAGSHLTSHVPFSLMSLQTLRNSFKTWIEDVLEPVVIALQEEGEDQRRCRQRAIELEEKKLLRKRLIILMKRRRAGRWSPTRRSKRGRGQKGAERAGT